MKALVSRVKARARVPPSLGRTALRAAAVWLALACLAFVNGAIRELFFISALAYTPDMAHQLSSLTAILLFTGCVWQLWPWMRLRTLAMSFAVGLAWLVATALTESFILNMWLADMSWDQVTAEYDVSAGKLWPLVLTWVGLLPPMVWATY